MIVLGIASIGIGVVFGVNVISEHNFDFTKLSLDKLVKASLLVVAGVVLKYIGIGLSHKKTINSVERMFRIPETQVRTISGVENLSSVTMRLLTELAKSDGLLLICLQLNTLFNILSDVFIVVVSMILHRSLDNVVFSYAYTFRNILTDLSILAIGIVIRRIGVTVGRFLESRETNQE